MPPHPLTNFEIIEYFKDETRFNGLYSKDSLPKTIKNGGYIINLQDEIGPGTHWVALFVEDNLVNSKNNKNNSVIYFDSYGVEYLPVQILKFIGNKPIKSSYFRIQSYDSVMCGFFCILFLRFMFLNKTLTDFINLFSL